MLGETACWVMVTPLDGVGFAMVLGNHARR
jgi:hypothetical protein